MRGSLAIAICILLSIDCGTTLAAQVTTPYWKHLGFSKDDSVDAVWFYDSNNIRRPSEATVRSWIKALHAADVDKEVEARSDVVDRLRDLRGKLAVTETLWDQTRVQLEMLREIDEVVNTTPIEPLMVVWYELDCKKAMIRGLSIHAKVDDKVRTEDRADEWRHIVPGSIQATLAELLCVD